MSPQRENIREQLSAYADGELTEAEASRVAQALAEDPELAAELAELQAVRELLRHLPRAAAPADLAERIMARAERGRLLDDDAAPAGRPAGWWLARLATAAIVLIAVGVGVSVVAMLTTPSWLEQVDSRTRRLPEAAGHGEALHGNRELAARLPGGERLENGGAIPSAPEAKFDASPEPEVPVTHFFINTDNLSMVQQEVERILRENDIEPVVQQAAPARPAKVIVSRGNFYDQSQLEANRVRFEVVVGEGHVRQIVQELNAVRAKQNVAQVPLGDLPDLARKKASGRDAAAGDATILAHADPQAETRNRRGGRPARPLPSKDSPGPPRAPKALGPAAGAEGKASRAVGPDPGTTLAHKAGEDDTTPDALRGRGRSVAPTTGAGRPQPATAATAPATAPSQLVEVARELQKGQDQVGGARPSVRQRWSQLGQAAATQRATAARANVRRLLIILDAEAPIRAPAK